MKKFSVLLAALLLAAMPASADTLTIDLDTATLEELTAAQEQISARVSNLRAAELDDVESIELSGSGTSIKTGIAVPFAPARVTLNASEKTDLKLTNADRDKTFHSGTMVAEYLDTAATYDVLIETSGDWDLSITPIVPGGTITISGTGPYVSDFFELPAACIVTLQADASQMDALMTNFIVKLNHQYSNISAWKGESLSNELLSSSDSSFTSDVIVNPTKGRSEYFWSVLCDPDVSWSITLKE